MGWAVSAAFLLGLAGCGRIITGSVSGDPSRNERRLYVNDAAANDSLAPALVRDGIRFVLQPSKAYALTLESNESEDKLAVYYYDASRKLRKYRDYFPAVSGAQANFYLESNLSYPTFFVAQLLPPDGNAAISRFRAVRLQSLGAVVGTVLKVKLILVGQLDGLGSDPDRESFAQSLFAEINALFAPHGLSVEGKFETADADGPPKVVAFSGSYTPLPGTREPGYVHLYLVSDILPPESAGDLGGYILGFSPREAMDLSLERESRVVLSNHFTSVARMATTASHEIGHFFGLRHPTATDIDMGFDRDYSNYDDGFASTTVCEGLAKAAGSSRFGPSQPRSEWKGPGGLTYCLRVTSASCPAFCDLDNLMFAYDCSTRSNAQRELTQDQITLWKKNLALLD